MLLARELVEHLIVWQPRDANCNIWLDNQTGQGDLYLLIEENWEENGQYQQVKDIMWDGRWDEQVIAKMVTPENRS